MGRLRLTGLSPDGQRLLLAGPDGTEHDLPVDETLRAAVRPRRQWQLEMAMDGELTPREIQARVRRGENPESLAAAAGVPLERVERFARPVLGERARIVELARATRLDPASLEPGPTLADRADEELSAARAEDVDWDSARDDDGRWKVTVSYTADGDLRTAAWWFDAATSTVTAADGHATTMQEPGGDVLPLARKRVAGPPPTPTEESPAPPMTSTQPLPSVTPTPAPAPSRALTHDTAPLPLPLETADPAATTAVSDTTEPAEEPTKSKRRKRSSVPSWDDIVFGARRDDA